MAKARNWETLKPATRKRYMGAGISRSDYMSGMSLKVARGHGRTPERPSRRKPQVGQEQYWVNKIVTEAFGSDFKFRGPKTVGVGDVPVPTVEELEMVLEMDPEDVRDLAGEGVHWSWLWYH